MAIFSDLELERIMNESNKTSSDDYKLRDQVEDNIENIRNLGISAKNNVKNNTSNLLKKNKDTKKKLTSFKFKKDKDGTIKETYCDNILYTEDDSIYNESSKQKKPKKETVNDKLRNLKIDSEIKTKASIEDIKDKPLEKTGSVIGSGIGSVVGTAVAVPVVGSGIGSAVGKVSGKVVGKFGDKAIKKTFKKENFDYTTVYRSKEYTKVMNEYFDITDTETRKVLLAVNEEDQSKVLVSLTSKLYENIMDKVDDIDFGEIPLSKGDITKLSNFQKMNECVNNMRNILIEFKQDVKPIITIETAIQNIINSTDIWKKAYSLNVELPMVTYNTIVLAIIESISYLMSMCIEFIKSPSRDTIQVIIDKSGLTKSKGHMIFKNLEDFNESYRKGQVIKAMNHVISENSAKKGFMGTTIGVGAGVVGIVGILFCIIPILRELIFLFYYNRVKISDFFDQQADMLQINSYNVENNRTDLDIEERKKISSKQLKIVEKFRKVSDFFAIKFKQSETQAINDIKKESKKKYKADEIMDELPDSAASALF